MTIRCSAVFTKEFNELPERVTRSVRDAFSRNGWESRDELEYVFLLPVALESIQETGQKFITKFNLSAKNNLESPPEMTVMMDVCISCVFRELSLLKESLYIVVDPNHGVNFYCTPCLPPLISDEIEFEQKISEILNYSTLR